jgi:hypothetical protein
MALDHPITRDRWILLVAERWLEHVAVAYTPTQISISVWAPALRES